MTAECCASPAGQGSPRCGPCSITCCDAPPRPGTPSSIVCGAAMSSRSSPKLREHAAVGRLELRQTVTRDPSPTLVWPARAHRPIAFRSCAARAGGDALPCLWARTAGERVGLHAQGIGRAGNSHPDGAVGTLSARPGISVPCVGVEARPARHEERACRAYVSDEQRSPAGYPGDQHGIVIPGRALNLHTGDVEPRIDHQHFARHALAGIAQEKRCGFPNFAGIDVPPQRRPVAIDVENA